MFHGKSKFKRPVKIKSCHKYDEAETPFAKKVERGLIGIGAGDAGHCTQVEFEVLTIDLFCKDSIGFYNERIVETAYKEHLLYVEAHKVVIDIPFFALFVVSIHKLIEIHVLIIACKSAGAKDAVLPCVDLIPSAGYHEEGSLF